MSILSNIFRCVRHIKTEEGYRKVSEWQLAKDVECTDGQTVEEKLNGLSNAIKPYSISSGAKAYTVNQTGWLEIPMTIPTGYKIIAQSAYFTNPTHVHVTGLWATNTKIMVGYRCVAAITATCAVDLTLAREELISDNT